MATFTKEFLTGRADGLQIAVAATATPGTLIHTADATAKDEIWIKAVNVTASDVILTIEWGGVATVDQIPVKIKKGNKGLMVCIDGNDLSNGRVVRAFASVANAINLSGFVNRIS